MNGEGARQGAPDHELSRRSEGTTASGVPVKRRAKSHSRGRRVELPLSRLEEAELRRLVYRAYGLRKRDSEAYREALEAIETWWVETLPDRIRRLEEGQS